MAYITTGGTYITIVGKQFGAKDTSPTAWLGNTKCQKTEWRSSTKMECKIPQIQKVGRVPIRVEVQGNTDKTERNIFLYKSEDMALTCV